MAFVNLSLLLGSLLIGVPIVLHLIMRQKPKKLVFPAIQFIQKRKETNRRSLRLRHWLLLLLRCLILLLAAMALARPSVSSGLFGNWLMLAGLGLLTVLIGLLLLAGVLTKRGRFLLMTLGILGIVVLSLSIVILLDTLRASSNLLIGDREAPVAAVMLFDSSPRMLYRQENRTRIEQAQEIAQWMLGQLPPESRVAVLDSRAVTPVFSVDLGAARNMIERVSHTGAPRPLERLLEQALELVRANSLKRKEIYVYTDLTSAAWASDDPERLQRKFQEASDVSLYLIDVGIESPQNIALGETKLSDQTATPNSPVSLSTTVWCTGAGGKRTVELLIEDLDPKLPVVRDDALVVPDTRLHSRQEITLPEAGSQEIEFTISSLDRGIRHARIRIVGQDALQIDNTRFVTIGVRQPWKILVVAPKSVNTSAFTEVIAPYEYRMTDRATYECETIEPDAIPNSSLEDFAAVILLDPTPLPSLTWEQLGTYVREGGQLAVFLGHHAGDGSEFRGAAAAALLPAKLGRQYRVSGRDVYLAPHSYDHPILRGFPPIATSVPWDQFPIFRYWNLQQLAPDAQVILRYGSNRPALVERPVGKGTVLTMTTPITEPERPRGRQAWNELAGPNDWPRFMLVNDLVHYLTHVGGEQYNFLTGQRVVLPNPALQAPSRYLLFLPDGETQPVQAHDEQLLISTTEAPGTYRLKGEKNGPVARGFSANLPAVASQLDRTTTEYLDEMLGPERYQTHTADRNEIEREQGKQRAGREFYSILLVVLAIMLLLEQLLANRFYRETDTSTP